MMTDAVILVCGFGRCGSSLVLQMLDRVGVPVSGEWPSFEAEQANAEHFDTEWVASGPGRAIKILDPHRDSIRLKPVPYRIFWLDRDPLEQAMSQIKFGRIICGLPWDDSDAGRLATSYKRDRPKALAKLEALGHVTTLHFETLIKAPLAGADVLCQALGARSSTASEMAKCVIRRSTACAPSFDLELALMRKGRPS